MQTVHAQYLLFTCTGLMHHWTIGYMLHCFQVEHVEDGQLRVLLPKEKKEWYFCKQRAFLFLTQKQFQNRKDFRFGPADVFLQLAFSQPPHKHPLILPFHSWINPPLHHPLILRPSTYVAHEKWEGGWERRWMKQGAENEREWGRRGEKSKIGKNALWLDLKVCGISFSERGELHLLQIL